MDLTTKERSAFELDMQALRFWLDDLGPHEPEPLLLAEDVRVGDGPLTSDELAQAVALGLRSSGCAD